MNAKIKEFYAHLVLSDVKARLPQSDFKCLVDILAAIALPNNLHALQVIAANLIQDYQYALDAIAWSEEIKNYLCYEQTLLKELVNTNHKFPAENAYSQHFGEYPLASLMAQSSNVAPTENDRRLLSMLRFVMLQVSRSTLRDGIPDGSLLNSSATELRKSFAVNRKNAIPEKITLNQLSALLDFCEPKLGIKLQVKFVDAAQTCLLTQLGLNERAIKRNRPSRPRSGSSLSVQPSAVANDDSIADDSGGIVTTTQYIPIAQTNEQDEQLVDLVSYTEQPDEITPDSHQIKHAIAYGSRLKLRQKFLLPWRSEVLSERETQQLMFHIRTHIEGDENELYIGAIATLMALVTSKPFDYLSQLMIGLPMGSKAEGILLNTGEWARHDVDLPSAFQAKGAQKDALEKHESLVKLPLPDLLIGALKTLMKAHACESMSFSGLLGQSSSELVEAYLHALHRLKNNGFHRRITPAAVRSFAYQQIAQKRSPVVASLVLANTEYQSPTPLYYLSLRHSQQVKVFASMLNCLDLRHPYVILNQHYSGSQLCFRDAYLKALLIQKWQCANEHIRLKDKHLSALIEAHNEIAAYTVLLALVFSGHRERKEYGFTQASIDASRKLIMLSDKVNFADSAFRIVPMPQVFFEQLNVYRHHCTKLAKILRSHQPELSQVLMRSGRMQIDSEHPLFLEIQSDGRWRAIGADFMRTYLGDAWLLPMNAFRHGYSDLLHRYNLGPYSMQFMGHIGAGEHPFSELSLMLPKELQHCHVNLDRMAQDLGVKALEGAKSDCAIYTALDIEQTPYFPRHQRKALTSHKAYAVARRLVEPYWDQLRAVNDDVKAASLRKEVIEAAQQNRAKCLVQGAFSRVIEYLNRFIDRALGNKALTKHWLLTPAQHNDLDKAHVYRNLLIEELHQRLRPWLLSVSPCSQHERLARFVVSIVLNTRLTQALSAQDLMQLVYAPKIMNAYVCLDFVSHGHRSSIIYDEVSAVLWRKLHREGGVEHIDISKLDLHIRQTLHALGIHIGKRTKSVLLSIQRLLQQSLPERSGLSCAIAVGQVPSTGLECSRLAKVLTPQIVPIKPEHSTPPINLRKRGYGLYTKPARKDKTLFAQLRKALNSRAALNQNISGLIQSVWASAVEKDKNVSLKALCEASGGLSTVSIAILYWLFQVSKRKGHARKQVAVATIRTYLSAVCNPALAHAGDLDFFSLYEDEYIEFYNRVLDSRALKKRHQRARILRDFHRCLVENFALPQLDWLEIEPRINIKEDEVSANVVDVQTYRRALALLHNDPHSNENQSAMQAALLIFCFKLGMRVGEVQRLRLDDISQAEWVVFVRTNRFGRVKSPNGNRRIAAEYLLSEDEKAVIQRLCLYASNSHPSANPLLYCDPMDATVSVYFEPIAARVVTTLRELSEDASMRLHHCRHAFVSYLSLIFHPLCAENDPLLSKLGCAWFDCAPDDFVERRHRLVMQWVGDSASSHKHIHAISLATGHAEPSTTIQHYGHFHHVMAYAENSQTASQAYSLKQLADLLDLSPSNARQIVKRYGKKEGRLRALIQKANWTGIARADLIKRPEIVLAKPAALVSDSRALLSMGLKLNCALTWYSENKPLEAIANELQLSAQMLSSMFAAAELVICQSGYKAVNLRFAQAGQRPILNHRQAQRMAYLWRDKSFCELFEQVVGANDNAELIDLAFFWVQFANRLPSPQNPSSIAVAHLLEKVVNKASLQLRFGQQRVVKHKIQQDCVDWSVAQQGGRRAITQRFEHILFLLAVIGEAKLMSAS